MEIDGFFIDSCHWRCGKKRWCYMNAKGGQRVDTCIRIDGESMTDLETGKKYKVKSVRTIAFCVEDEDENRKDSVVREESGPSEDGEVLQEDEQESKSRVSDGGDTGSASSDIEAGEETEGEEIADVAGRKPEGSAAPLSVEDKKSFADKARIQARRWGL